MLEKTKNTKKQKTPTHTKVTILWVLPFGYLYIEGGAVKMDATTMPPCRSST